MGANGNRSGYGMTAGSVDLVDASGAGVSVVPGLASKRLGLCSLVISATAICQVKVVDGDGNLVFPRLSFPANGGISSGEFTANSYSAKGVGKDLKIVSDNNSPVSAAIEAYIIQSNPSS